MSTHTARRLAWSLWVLALALEVAAVVLWLANHAVLVSRFGTAQDITPHLLVMPGFGTVGAVIAARRRNPIGWLFLGFGLLAALLSFTSVYFMRGFVVTPGSLPAARVGGWIGPVLWPASYLFLCLLLLLFPDGRLPSPRWRPIALALGMSWGALAIYYAFEPTTSIIHGVTSTNPLGVQALTHPAWKAVAKGASAIASATLGAAALAPLLRFRRADPVQRQQLKWFAFVIGVSAASMLAAVAVQGFLPAVASMLSDVALAGVVVGLPAAVALAILRYRLYDIDRLISRTLVYGLLTALLAGVYVIGVFVVGRLLNPATGDSALAVAASTLAVAALFQPLRSRIQRLVDRRFNRRRYDAVRTVEAFSGRLRDEIDLDSLSAELLSVVDQTVQPAQASLWLRPTGARALLVQQGK